MNKMSKIINDSLLQYTKNLPCREIVLDGELYLRRYFVNIDAAGRQTWLHEILKPDSGRALHSHPWFAQSRIISGRYSEELLLPEGKKDMKYYRVGDFNIIEPTTIHRITEVWPHTWTELSVAPGREPLWFFVDKDGVRESVTTNDEHWYKTALTRDGKQPKVNWGLYDSNIAH